MAATCAIALVGVPMLFGLRRHRQSDGMTVEATLDKYPSD